MEEVKQSKRTALIQQLPFPVILSKAAR